MEGFVKRGLPGAVLSSLLVMAALKRTNLTGMKSNLLSIGGSKYIFCQVFNLNL